MKLQDFLPKLTSIGIAFGKELDSEASDIEQTLIESLKYIKNDLKLLSLIVYWSKIMGDLVHVERLKVLLKDCEDIELAFMGAIAASIENDYQNWNLITRYCDKKLKKRNRFVLHEKMSIAIDYGVAKCDPHFEHFGLRIPVIQTQDSKKLIPRKYLIQDHPQLWARSVFGVNWRADIFCALNKDIEINAYQLSKKVGCSYETAYRIRKAFMATRVFDKIKQDPKPNSDLSQP